jgi:hypothetical protein
MGGWFGNFARTAGGVGNDVSSAQQANTALSTQAAAEKLKQIMAGLQIQELQQKLKQSGQPQPYGLEKLPSGAIGGVTFDQGTGTYKIQTLADGTPSPIDKEGFRKQLLSLANEGGASALEKRVYSGLIGSLDSGMAPEKVMEDFNRFLTSRSETGPTTQEGPKVEIFGGYKWQFDPAKKIQGTRDATGQYVKLGPAKEPGTGDSGDKTPFELWKRDHPKGTYDQWIQDSKQEDRTDATNAVKAVMSASTKLQSLNLAIQKMNKQFSIWNPKTYGNDPLTQMIAQQAMEDYQMKKDDAVAKLTAAGLPVPAWLTQSSGGQPPPPPAPNMTVVPVGR